MGGLNEIDARLDELRAEGVHGSREITALRAERSDLGIPTLREEGTLAAISWTWQNYGRRAGGGVTLVAIERGYQDNLVERVHKIMRFGYHSNCNLEDGVNLRVNDGEVAIHFASPSRMVAFIQEWEITKIDWEYIHNERASRIKELRAWDEILTITVDVRPPPVDEEEEDIWYDYDDPGESPYAGGGPPTPA